MDGAKHTTDTLEALDNFVGFFEKIILKPDDSSSGFNFISYSKDKKKVTKE